MTSHRIRNIAIGTVIALMTGTSGASAQLSVFDPLNYTQNLLQAVRALDAVENQIRQLQGQAQTLARLDQNLLAQVGSISPQLQSTLTSLRAQVTQGNALALTVRDTDANYQRLFPTTFPDALSGNSSIAAARSRWDETYGGFKRAALLQGQVVDSVDSDGRLLDGILGRSQSSVGALQAIQAGNELTALQVKQALQLQTLLAAQQRAETIDRVRSVVAEEEARQRFQAFLGDGSAYTRQR